MNLLSILRQIQLPRFRVQFSSQRSRIWYAASLAAFLTGITGWVACGMFGRVWQLSEAVPKHLQAVKQLSLQLTASGKKTLADAADHYREHLDAERQIASFEADEHTAMSKAISDLAGFEETLGRPIRVTPGPPQQYDPGDAPTYPILWDKLAFVVSSNYRSKCIAWKLAKEACDALNSAEAAFGSSLESARIKYRRTREELGAAKHAVSASISALRPAAQDEGEDSISSLDAALRWSDLDRRQAWTTTGNALFCLLDLPTLLACLAMTAVAWSRLLLACGSLGQTRIERT